MKRSLLFATAVLGAASVGSAALAGSSSVNLSNGAALTVSVDTPLTGSTYLIPQGQTSVDVPVGGTATVGTGAPNAAWIYVIDVSGSTSESCGAGGTILSCEKTAISTLNAAVVAGGSGVEVGVAAFSINGVVADMSAAPGSQLLVAPNDPGFPTVIASVNTNVIGQFTAQNTGGPGTNYTAGLQAALTIVNGSTAAQKNVVFLSDGFSNAGTVASFNTVLASLASAGAKIYPFALGPAVGCSGGGTGTLDDMAAATGTTCVVVPDPLNLPDIVEDLTATSLDAVGLTIDGASTSVALSAAVPAPGPVARTYSATAEDQVAGSHEACATSTGTGPVGGIGATASTTRCETYDVYAFTLTPPTATNELGVDSMHTVTAALTGPAGKLAGFPVTFAVTGTNAGATGTCVPVNCETSAAGLVSFTYSVPIASASLGNDTISATVTVGSQRGTATVTKKWQDTTAPTGACPASANPGGNIPQAPGNGGQGQNQDGFYQLTATDDVWATSALKMYVTDDGSGQIFGPFPVGTNIKYTQANGAAPSIKPMSGAVQWQIKGKGDAIVTAVDGSGSISAAVTCLVPRRPK
jgi:hypothetical protein